MALHGPLNPRPANPFRRALLLVAPAALAARLLPAQKQADNEGRIDTARPDIRLPSGKMQRDEILKADYEKNVKDAREMAALAKSFQEELEKDQRFVLSVASLKKLDEIEKIAKRVRGRLRGY